VSVSIVYVAYPLFLFGTGIACLNFYLSFLAESLHAWWGKDYRYVSGIPLFGSIAIASAILLLWNNAVVFWLGILFIAIDTGGLHWYPIAVALHMRNK
jgi:hypothetical protein